MRPKSASRSFRHEIWVISFDGKETVWLIVAHWKAKTDHFILGKGLFISLDAEVFFGKQNLNISSLDMNYFSPNFIKISR